MSWGLILLSVYLLGMSFAACVFARPINRLMGGDSQPQHIADEGMAETRVLVATVVTGVAMLWPLTVSLYGLTRVIPASDMADDNHVSSGIDILCEEEVTRAH